MVETAAERAGYTLMPYYAAEKEGEYYCPQCFARINSQQDLSGWGVGSFDFGVVHDLCGKRIPVNSFYAAYLLYLGKPEDEAGTRAAERKFPCTGAVCQSETVKNQWQSQALLPAVGTFVK